MNKKFLIFMSVALLLGEVTMLAAERRGGRGSRGGGGGGGADVRMGAARGDFGGGGGFHSTGGGHMGSGMGPGGGGMVHTGGSTVLHGAGNAHVTHIPASTAHTGLVSQPAGKVVTAPANVPTRTGGSNLAAPARIPNREGESKVAAGRDGGRREAGRRDGSRDRDGRRGDRHGDRHGHGDWRARGWRHDWFNLAAIALAAGIVWSLNGVVVGPAWELVGWDECWNDVYQEWMWCGPDGYWFTPQLGYFYIG